MTAPYTDPEFFLVGMQRSGTTLLQSIINGSGQMELTDECWWIPCLHEGKGLYEAYFTRGGDAGWNDAVRAMHRELLRKSGRFGLQTIGCRNALHADYLHALYPGARFVHLVRDPRDTLISTLRTGIFSSPMAFRDSYQSLTAFYERAGAAHRILRYEDLTTRPVETIHELCAFLGIDYSPDMLVPLSRRISKNLSPALDGAELAGGKVRPDPSVTERWRRQLSTLDLLDLSELYPVVRELGYPVYETKKVPLTVDGEGFEGARLIGARVHGSGETEVGEAVCRVDLCSLGAVGIRFPEGGRVRSVRLEGAGALEPAPFDDRLYTLRFDPPAEPSPYRCRSWNGLVETFPDLADRRLAIYSAGGATRAFLKEFHARGLDARFAFDAILDRQASGVLHGIPILGAEDADLGAYDLILVTSFAHYEEIMKDLASRGLREFEDFTAVMFPNQELVRWW